MQLKLAAVLVTASFGVAGVAHADGSLTVRGVYYKEKSTRVIQPMLDSIFDVGTRGTLTGHLLVDAITSASAGSGAANAAAFTERRYEGALGYTHAFDRMRLGGDFKYSTESDYESIYFGVHGEIDLAQKNAVIGYGAGASLDDVSTSMSGGLGSLMLACDPIDPHNTAKIKPDCSLDVYSQYLSASQVLGRNTVVSATFDISELSGFQSNPYRIVVGADGSQDQERHPDSRRREALAASARYYVASTRTTVIAAYRYYHDNWKIQAHTPELRIVQEVGDNADAGLRYRYYTQSAAFFFSNKYPTTAPSTETYITDDPKMSAFDGHIIEAKLGVFGREFDLGGTWAGARFEGILEYIIQNNRFGNAVVAHVALTLPFAY